MARAWNTRARAAECPAAHRHHRERVGSSTRIEGSKLTDREVEHLLGKLEITSFASRDEQEVAGYAKVMEIIFQAWAEIPVNENHVRRYLPGNPPFPRRQRTPAAS